MKHFERVKISLLALSLPKAPSTLPSLCPSDFLLPQPLNILSFRESLKGFFFLPPSKTLSNSPKVLSDGEEKWVFLQVSLPLQTPFPQGQEALILTFQNKKESWSWRSQEGTVASHQKNMEVHDRRCWKSSSRGSWRLQKGL